MKACCCSLAMKWRDSTTILPIPKTGSWSSAKCEVDDEHFLRLLRVSVRCRCAERTEQSARSVAHPLSHRYAREFLRLDDSSTDRAAPPERRRVFVALADDPRERRSRDRHARCVGGGRRRAHVLSGAH